MPPRSRAASWGADLVDRILLDERALVVHNTFAVVVAGLEASRNSARVWPSQFRC